MSPAAVVQMIMEEFGKKDADLQKRVAIAVGDVTIDLLSQNESRFRKLQKTYTITISAGTKAYILPSDFKTAQKKFIQVDSSGDFVAELEIVTERDILLRQSEDTEVSAKSAFIEYRADGTDGPGQYLVLGAEPTATGYYKFYYYRVPTAADTDIIDNVTILKTGVKARFPVNNPLAAQDLIVYEKMRSGFIETPETHTTQMVMRPSSRVSKHNRMMHDIGRGN